MSQHMNKFIDRMEFQRSVVKMVNSSMMFRNDICGLSKPAIEVWAKANQLQTSDTIYQCVYEISEAMCSLASKSQEDVLGDSSLHSCIAEEKFRELSILMSGKK